MCRSQQQRSGDPRDVVVVFYECEKYVVEWRFYNICVLTIRKLYTCFSSIKNGEATYYTTNKYTLNDHKYYIITYQIRIINNGGKNWPCPHGANL